MNKLLRVLIIEDVDDDAMLLVRELERGGFEVNFERVDTAAAMRIALNREAWDLILCDFTMPYFDGAAALRLAKECSADVPFIYVSGTIGEDVAIEAMKSGAQDYIMKTNLTRLVPAIRRELQDVEVRRESRRAETAMRESEHKYRHLFEALSDAVFLIDETTGKIIDTNTRAETFLSRPRGEIVGMNQSQLFKADDGGFATLLAAADRRVGCELKVALPDGRVAPVHASASRIELYNRPLLLTLLRDVTERNRMEEQLRQLSRAVEQSPVSVVITDTQGNIQYANSRCMILTGYAFSELYGKNPRIFQSGRTPRDTYSQLWTTLTAGKEWRGEFLNKKKNGDLYWQAAYIAPIVNDQGQLTHFLAIEEDITDRKRMETALHESELRFRQLAETIKSVFWISPAGPHEISYVSPAFEEIWGHRRAELYQQPTLWFSSIVAEDRARVDAALKGLAEGSSYDIQFQIQRPDGERRWIEDRGFALRDADGRIYRMLGVATDITARKTAEMALARERNLLHTLMTSLPDAIYFKDRECRFTQINPAQARRFGLKDPAEVVGRSDFDFFEEEHARQACQDELEIIRTGRALIEKVEKEVWPDGRITWVMTTKMPLRDETGEIVGTFGISRDITGRKHAEEIIREQAALLDKAQDSIFVLTLDGHITYWSKGSERMTGWTAAEAIGKNVIDLLFHGLKTPALLDCIRQTEERGEWVGELGEFTRDGRNIIVQGRSNLIRDDQGQPKAILVLDTDITEKKRLEAQFLRAQRMESVGTLASGIAHDLNNVLAPLLMSIQLLRQKIQTPEAGRLIDILERNARRGADLVKQVLTFGRGIEGEHAPVDVRRLTREIQQIVRETFPKSIHFDVHAATTLWPVIGDATQLHQVLLNLCVNARDAMPGGGTLFIDIANQYLDDKTGKLPPSCKAGTYVAVSVRDTGIGMSPEIQEKMFNPFFTTKPAGKGTGLGLSTSLGIVKNHGGFIDCVSEPGKGTCFTVYLPADVERTARTTAAAVAKLPPGQDELVLVVDDEEGIRRVARQILEQFRYRVMLATDGAEAAALYHLHQSEIKAVITDLAMPVMDGLATIKALQTVNPEVVVIVSTGMHDDDGVEKAKAAGVHHFVPKPYTAETLLQTLHEALHSQPADVPNT